MNEVDRKIKKYFHVKGGDNLPYTGWLDSNRSDLYKFMATMEFKLGAEIGVSRGTNARNMLDLIPDLHLILVDPWCAYNRLSDEKAMGRYNKCVQRMEGRNVEFKKMFSLDAAKEIPDGSLDFVYIDGLHEFDAVIMDIIAWVPKVRKNGIVAGHDYYEFYQSGVVEAVKMYTSVHNIQDWYVTKTEKEPTWFWVNK